MAIDPDDEILQDFLVEAGEILEQLNEQLVDLEQSPDDLDLLNAIFRGFHTVKGGAGFLGLDNLVEVCHKSEDIFNLMRNGERSIEPELMDAILQVLDVVNAQFDELRGGQEPSPAPPDLLATLARYAVPEGEAPVADEAAAPESAAAGMEDSGGGDEAADEGDITDAEFEALLDAMPESGAGAGEGAAAEHGTEAGAGSDEITDEEFEALLDQLHGKGQFKPEAVKPGDASSGAGAGGASEAAGDGSGSDEITDEEFEALLDQLHGKGQFKPEVVKSGDAGKAAETQQPASKPEPEPKAKPESKPKPEPKPKPAAKKPDAGAGKGAAAHKAPAETTVRVDTRRLDDIMNLVGELVLVRNRLATLRASMHDEQISKAIGNLDLVTSDLQDAVMKTRMQPIKKVFGRFPRVVRDLSRSLNKEVRLELRGEDTDLDKNLVEALADPLVHLVRNAVDHGIEPPDEREKAGKPREGHVILAAAQEGDHILLTIQDDGKGMDPEVLRQKAVEKGLMDEEAARRLSDKDAYNLIFMPGFSTKTEISDVSGRGVGMDVVKTSIAQLNGTVEIDSELGKGSVISIKVPLTLAIMPTLMIIVGDQRFAVPLTSVNEIFDLDLSRTNTVDDQEVIVVREKALPLFYLRHWLVRGADPNERVEQGHVVVATVGNQQVGLVVDGLVGQEEVVIKPLGAGLRGLPGFSGATITGDGGIALILDLPSLIKAHA